MIMGTVGTGMGGRKLFMGMGMKLWRWWGIQKILGKGMGTGKIHGDGMEMGTVYFIISLYFESETRITYPWQWSPATISFKFTLCTIIHRHLCSVGQTQKVNKQCKITKLPKMSAWLLILSNFYIFKVREDKYGPPTVHPQPFQTRSKPSSNVVPLVAFSNFDKTCPKHIYLLKSLAHDQFLLTTGPNHNTYTSCNGQYSTTTRVRR